MDKKPSVLISPIDATPLRTEYCGTERIGDREHSAYRHYYDASGFVAEMMRDARHRRGWTLEEAAAVLNITRTALLEIERGKRTLSEEDLVKARKALLGIEGDV